MPKPGGMGGIYSPNNLTLACIWALVFTWIRGEKVFPILVKTFLFLGLSLICLPEKNCGWGSFPQHWKQGKIGVKLQIIPPNAQQRSAPLAVNHFLVHSSPKNSLWSAKNVVFFLFCILADRPMKVATAPPPTPTGYTTGFMPVFCCLLL